MEDKKERKLLWLSPLAAGLILTLVFKAAHRFPGDTHIFLVGDDLGQFMGYIVMFWRKLLSGNGLFYSFDIGLGAATWEHYSFYGFSPFNLVFIMIRDADTASFILYLLKVCMIAFTMHLFLTNGIKVSECLAAAFSVSYALSSFAVCFHYAVIFLDYLYILPVVMLMLIRFFRTGKAGGLAAAYAYSFLTSYYGGYMIGLFSFICFWVMLAAGRYDISKKKLLLRYAVSGCIAVLISAVVTLPTAGAVMSGRTGESGGTLDIRLHLWDVLEALFPFGDKIYVDSEKPAIYSGLIVLITSFGYFFDKQKKVKEKVTAFVPLVFLLLCTLFKPAYLFIHGFDEPDCYFFRFAFIYSFYLAAVGARWLEERKADIVFAPFALAMILEVSFMLKRIIVKDTEQEPVGAVSAMIVCVLIFAYYFALKKGKKIGSCLLACVAFFELFISGVYFITPDTPDLCRWRQSYDLWNYQGNEALRKIEEAENNCDGFYRVNYRYGIFPNDSMYFGFHGLGYFSSMEQRNTRELLHDLGYATSSRFVMEKGGSPFTEMIFSQKYRVAANPRITAENHELVEVKKNEYALPLAFMVSDNIKSVQMEESVFANQQKLMDAMLGKNCKIWDSYSGNVSVNSDNAEIGYSGEDFYITRKEAGDALVTLSVPTGETGEHYAYISTKWLRLYDGSPVVYSDVEDETEGQIYTSDLYMPAMIRIGNGRGNIYIRLDLEGDDEAAFEKAYFADCDMSGIRNAYEELSEGGLRITKFRDDEICGNIKVNAGKRIMFTGIPYDENWHVLADGAEMETFPALDGALLACELTEGEHEVRIYYKNKLIQAGMILSLAGSLLFFVVFSGFTRRISSVKKD